MKKIIMTIAAVALCGCAATNLSPDRVLVENGTYVSEISATDSRRASDNFITVAISGQTYEDTSLYWRVVWFDETGTAIKTTMSKPTLARVRRGQPFHWSAVAPNKNAATYQVYVSGRPIEQ